MKQQLIINDEHFHYKWYKNSPVSNIRYDCFYNWVKLCWIIYLLTASKVSWWVTVPLCWTCRKSLFHETQARLAWTKPSGSLITTGLIINCRLFVHPALLNLFFAPNQCWVSSDPPALFCCYTEALLKKGNKGRISKVCTVQEEEDFIPLWGNLLRFQKGLTTK